MRAKLENLGVIAVLILLVVLIIVIGFVVLKVKGAI